MHNRFKKLVDGQLEGFIQDLGISPQDFVTACSKAASKVHKNLLIQLLSVDDFLLFKQLMVQRNMQMNMEAINAMKKQGKNVNLIERKVAKQAVKQSHGEVEDEDKAIERALAESKALYVSLTEAH